MADIKILHQNATIVQGMIDDTARLLVHANFIPYITFKKAVEKGLNPEKWESSANSNGNKILIEGIPYKQYIENMSDKNYKIDIKGNITSLTVSSMIIGDYAFDMKELGELLNDLINERKLKKSSEAFHEALINELKENKTFDMDKFLIKFYNK